ncbi:MAG: aminopeptidase P family protein [Clostridia bacterium]|nr:aminopeptidase P family protein [Clostridia bacterium]
MITKQLSCVANAFKELKSEYKAGVSCDIIRKRFLSSIKKQLKECSFKYDFLLGVDTLNIDGVSKGAILKEGDTLLIDISVKHNGVWCDVCRTFFVGEPTKFQRDTFSMIVRSIKAGEKVLKAGVKACDVYNAVNGVYQESGYSLIHHAGHKIGSRALLQPQFLMEKQGKVKCGEYFTIESGLYKNCGIRLENDYLITENGADNLFEGLLPLKIEEYILR